MIAQIATFIYKRILASRHKLSFRFYTKLRALVLKFADPLITISFRTYTLKMPFSHTIFLNQKLYPTYDMQLHKIASYITQKMGFIHIVDVGANIGDTAVSWKYHHRTVPFPGGALIPGNWRIQRCGRLHTAYLFSMYCLGLRADHHHIPDHPVRYGGTAGFGLCGNSHCKGDAEENRCI